MEFEARDRILGRSEHFAHFYESEDFIASFVSKYLVEGLKVGETCIVAATPKHIDDIERNIAASFAELEANRKSGIYITLDASDTLSKILINGMPDSGRFSAVIGQIVRKAAERGSGIRVFGELVAVLWAEKNYKAAIRLEELWNDLGKQYRFSLFCAYPMAGFIHSSTDHVCGELSRTITEENYDPFACADERLRAISQVHFTAAI